jgi:SNF2 family DNA or RNA helicase
MQDSVVIFSKYVTTLALLDTFLSHSTHWINARNGREVLFICGRTSKAERSKILKHVWKNGCQPYILLVTIKVGGVGWNTTTANTAILLELQWNPAVEEQARDRLHRIGQQSVVHIYRIVTDLEIDQSILACQARKHTNIKYLFKHAIAIYNTKAAALTLDELLRCF